MGRGDGAEKSPYRYLAGICAAKVLISVGMQNYPPLIPILQREWEMSSAAAGSVISAYQAGFLISLVGLSSLTDWVSTRKVFLYSCLASAVAFLLFAFYARSFLSAFLLRGLIGLALGGTYTPGLKLISEIFSSSWRGRAMGFFIGAGSLGQSLSLAATGWIAARYGWETAFFATTLGPALGTVVAFLALKGMPERKPEPVPRQFKRELVGNRPALLMIGGYTAHVWELEGMRAWTPAFLVACFTAAGSVKAEAVQAGATFSAIFFIMGVLSTGMAGYLSDRFGRTAVIIAIMFMSIFCSFSFGWLIEGPMVWIILVGLVYGFSVIADSPVYSSGLTEVVSPNLLGTALGFRSLIGFSVAALVPTVFGAVLDLSNPGGLEKTSYIATWGWAFSMLGLVALIGPWTMFRVRAIPESVKMAGGKK